MEDVEERRGQEKGGGKRKGGKGGGKGDSKSHHHRDRRPDSMATGGMQSPPRRQRDYLPRSSAGDPPGRLPHGASDRSPRRQRSRSRHRSPERMAPPPEDLERYPDHNGRMPPPGYFSGGRGSERHDRGGPDRHRFRDGGDMPPPPADQRDRPPRFRDRGDRGPAPEDWHERPRERHRDRPGERPPLERAPLARGSNAPTDGLHDRQPRFRDRGPEGTTPPPLQRRKPQPQ
eukprot:TRINITY_DN64524_c0_g1_i1.p2 TRINITY_DN64524_c0_g1~~TRINITY_DN64524_c0_g1_i1.p2  ORF type:complete len:231 (-),score=21.39 TRINITY_DN64524_c0_g1_i1:142-834(-)